MNVTRLKSVSVGETEFTHNCQQGAITQQRPRPLHTLLYTKVTVLPDPKSNFPWIVSLFRNHLIVRDSRSANYWHMTSRWTLKWQSVLLSWVPRKGQLNIERKRLFSHNDLSSSSSGLSTLVSFHFSLERHGILFIYLPVRSKWPFLRPVPWLTER